LRPRTSGITFGVNPDRASTVSTLQNILAALGGLVVGGGILGTVVYTIFKILGEKWLNAKFEERLAAYKHAQQRELEELKFQINTLMDRTLKLHQREFDVLPEAWGRLNDAFKVIRPVTLGFQQSPDVNAMSVRFLGNVRDLSKRRAR
jgi:hypothetical protein